MSEEKETYPAGEPSMPPTNRMAVISFVLGILAILSAVLPFLTALGYLFVSLLFAIPAIILGQIARKQIKKSDSIQGGNELALAGFIMGGLVVVFGVCLFLLVLLANIIYAPYFDFDLF